MNMLSFDALNLETRGSDEEEFQRTLGSEE